MTIINDAAALIKKAELLYSQYERRGTLFGTPLVSDHGWEILLHLFLKGYDQNGFSFSFMHLSQSASLLDRWMRALEAAGLAHVADDGRTAQLSETGREKMVIYLQSIDLPLSEG